MPPSKLCGYVCSDHRTAELVAGKLSPSRPADGQQKDTTCCVPGCLNKTVTYLVFDAELETIST
jgi:hypothetical protein